MSKTKDCCRYSILLALTLCTICSAKQSESVNPHTEQARAAIAELSASLQKNPKDYESQYRRAMYYGQVRDYPNAIADFSKAIKLNPGSTTSTKGHNNHSVSFFYLALSYQNRGLTYLRMDQYQKGIDDIGKAIEMRPEYAPNYQTRAMFLEKLGDMAGAKRDYEQYNALVYAKQHGISHKVK